MPIDTRNDAQIADNSEPDEFNNTGIQYQPDLIVDQLVYLIEDAAVSGRLNDQVIQYLTRFSELQRLSAQYSVFTT